MFNKLIAYLVVLLIALFVTWVDNPFRYQGSEMKRPIIYQKYTNDSPTPSNPKL